MVVGGYVLRPFSTGLRDRLLSRVVRFSNNRAPRRRPQQLLPHRLFPAQIVLDNYPSGVTTPLLVALKLWQKILPFAAGGIAVWDNWLQINPHWRLPLEE